MGEAKRKQLQKHMQAMGFEGQNLWKLKRLSNSALLDGMESGELKTVAAVIYDAVFRSPPGEGPLCLTCDAEISAPDNPPGGFVLLTPHIPKPIKCTVHMLCPSCYGRPDALERAFGAIRDQSLSDARIVSIHEQEGHA